MQRQFAIQATQVAQRDRNVIGLAVAGSWLTKGLDEYSDLDLILVTDEKVSGDKERMLSYARKFGKLLSGFTGEHVGEPRVLICLFDEPLLHVDIKFLTLDEFEDRIETPVILYDTNDQLRNILESSEANFPYPENQWIEDRFWVWVHYTLLKIGRGEYLVAIDSLNFLRCVVIGPLMHIKNGNLPRGVRKAETQLSETDFIQLKSTLADYDRMSLVMALENCVSIYRQLRNTLFDESVELQTGTEMRVMEYLQEIKHHADD